MALGVDDCQGEGVWTAPIGIDRGDVRRVLELAPDPSKVSLLTEFDPTAVPGSGVPDPFFGSDSGFHDTLTAIEAAMPGLLDRIRELQNANPGC